MDNEITSTNLESFGKKKRKIAHGKGSSGRTARFTGKPKRRKRAHLKR